jgi:hypothetical protein
MYGAYLRGGITAAIVALVGSILRFILPYLLPYLGPEDELIYQSFSALGSNVVLLGLIAVAAGILAAAVSESNAGGVR